MAIDGKCAYIHKRASSKLKNYFDAVILNQKIPFLTCLESAIEILNIDYC